MARSVPRSLKSVSFHEKRGPPDVSASTPHSRNPARDRSRVAPVGLAESWIEQVLFPPDDGVIGEAERDDHDRHEAGSPALSVKPIQMRCCRGTAGCAPRRTAPRPRAGRGDRCGFARSRRSAGPPTIGAAQHPRPPRRATERGAADG